ncbi:hypothetical protein ACVOMV_24735 [Mesorhizobium atlanticum]
MADATGTGMDQRALSCLQAAVADEALPGCQAGERQGRGMRVVDGGGLRSHLVRRRRGWLGKGSSLLGKARHAEHLIAHIEGGHAGAERLDGP